MMQKNILKVLSVLAVVLSLAGCFDSLKGNNSVALPHTYTDEDDRYEISYPDTFLVVPEADLPSGALVGIVDLGTDGFVSNVTVTAENLAEDISSIRFAMASIRKAAENLVGYLEVLVEDTEISGQETKIHIFTLDRQSQKAGFIQTYLVSGERGFVVTATYANDVSEEAEKTLMDMVKSFRLLASKS